MRLVEQQNDTLDLASLLPQQDWDSQDMVSFAPF
jgi:hypothetical protein